MPHHTLLLGGARSGKSARAIALLDALARPAFVATAQAFDDEMRARIDRHRRERGAHWRTLEAPLDPAAAIATLQESADAIVVDCLTLWLSNLMHHGHPPPASAADTLVATLAASAVPVVLVSNETGLGLVPETPLGRAFRDEQGRLNQRMAAAVDVVELVVAGLPLSLKG